MTMQIARKPLVHAARVIVFLLAISCLTVAAAPDDAAGREGWSLQFSDDFGRAELGKNWQIVSGDWKIRDGMLHVDRPGVLLCTWRFSGSLRLEFDAIAAGDDISDLSAILNAKQGGNVSDGYFFGFGSDDNTTSKLLVKGRVVKRCGARIVPGKRHHVVCQREGGNPRQTPSRGMSTRGRKAHAHD